MMGKIIKKNLRQGGGVSEQPVNGQVDEESCDGGGEKHRELARAPRPGERGAQRLHNRHQHRENRRRQRRLEVQQLHCVHLQRMLLLAHQLRFSNLQFHYKIFI
jgi:hypothetical protein